MNKSLFSCRTVPENQDFPDCWSDLGPIHRTSCDWNRCGTRGSAPRACSVGPIVSICSSSPVCSPTCS